MESQRMPRWDSPHQMKFNDKKWSFSWTKSVLTETFSLYHYNPVTSLSNQELKKRRKMMFWTNIKNLKTKGTKLFFLESIRTKLNFSCRLQSIHLCYPSFSLWSFIFQPYLCLENQIQCPLIGYKNIESMIKKNKK